MNIQSLIPLAERVLNDAAYTYEHFALDLIQQLAWTGAVDVATALRSHVYGSSGRSELHAGARALYDRLGWQQSALVACWFRDCRNWPNTSKPPRKRPSGRPGPPRTPS